jgi:predicted Zn finger-like uncharacterized protein
MILTCPQCSTQFAVPPNAITADGRKVRCAKCKHVWHQYPIEDKVAKETDGEKNNQTPSGQKPENTEKPQVEEDLTRVENTNTETDNTSKSDQFKSAVIVIKQEIVTGYPSILIGLFVVFFGYFLISMMHSPLVMGDGVIFSDVVIDRDDDGLSINGQLTNTIDNERGLPSILVTVFIDDIEGDSSIFNAPQDVLPAGETIDFELVVDKYPENVTDVRVGFSLSD